MNLSDVTSLLFTAIESVVGWFHNVFDSISGSFSAFSFVFFVILVTSRLLIPWIGSFANGSDRVKNTKSKTNNKKGG